MPKSKRDKKVSLTKTTKKGLDFKKQMVEDLRKCVDDYERIFVFSVQNMRNTKLKDLRSDMKKDSRFFFGKNKVMQIGLGKNKQEEYQENLYKLSKQLLGQCGLLFTNKTKKDVVEYFEEFSSADFARSGFIATDDVVLPEGPLPNFSHALEPHLRQLGMPTSLQRGVITLLSEFTVCKKGATLTPEQARILKLLGITMADFRVTLKCMWDKDGNKFKKLKSSKSSNRLAKDEESFELRMEEDEIGNSNDNEDVEIAEEEEEEEDDDDKEESDDENGD